MSKNYAEILREQVEALDSERAALLAELDTLAPDESRSAEDVETRATEITERAKAILTERDAKTARIAELVAIRAERAEAPKAPNFVKTSDRSAIEQLVEDRSAQPRQINDAIIKALDERGVDHTQAARLLKRHGADTNWSRDLLLRSTDVYASAWQKCVMGRDGFLTAEERAAISATTTTQGGYLVPTHLDPTIILTNDGSSNVIRGISRVVTLTEGNVWNGVTSAGVTASFDAALTEVSDDSPTFGNAQISIHKAQAFVQAAIEAFEDINSLASDVLMLFADAKDRLEGAAHATGTGTNEPVGIFTALDANTNVEITSTTAATIGVVDLKALYNGVPVRWRNRGKWLMNPTWNLEIQALGTALGFSYTTDLTQSPTGQILGKEVVESDDAPEVTTTTVRDNRIVYGDFSNYVIVDKPGSTAVEFIPHLFNTTTNLPDGRRGWYMHWRTGADSVNDVSFRLLQDKTSA
jgi:HK97 family phage major capsid protein